MSIISHENWGESLSGYLSAPSEIGGSGDLAHGCLHPQTCLYLWSQFTWLYHHLYIGALFFPPNQEQKRSMCPRSDFWKQRPGQYLRKYRSICWGVCWIHSFRGGRTPFFNVSLQTTSVTTKRNMGNLFPLKLHSLLSLGGGTCCS